MEIDYEAYKQRVNTNNYFMIHSGIRCTDIGPDFASFAGDLTPSCLNPYGAAHGGFLFTMADCCTGCAAHSDGRHYVTLTSSLNFMRMAQQGTVVANARVVKRGKTVVVTECTIECNGQELANGSFTFFCLDAK